MHIIHTDCKQSANSQQTTDDGSSNLQVPFPGLREGRPAQEERAVRRTSLHVLFQETRRVRHVAPRHFALHNRRHALSRVWPTLSRYVKLNKNA